MEVIIVSNDYCSVYDYFYLIMIVFCMITLMSLSFNYHIYYLVLIIDIVCIIGLLCTVFLRNIGSLLGLTHGIFINIMIFLFLLVFFRDFTGFQDDKLIKINE